MAACSLVLVTVMAVTYFNEAEAVTSKVVGTISAVFNPNAGAGSEFVTLSFSGVLSRDSYADLTNWTLRNRAGEVYDLSDVILSNTESVKICEAQAADPGCTYYWSGTDVFNDNQDELKLVDSNGVVVVFIPYTDADPGETYSDSGSYITNVYGPGDKVTICETKKNGVQLNDAAAKKLVNELTKNSAFSPTDVVPAFVYEFNKEMGYHPGINWPDQKQKLATGC